ncbi:hypothetical protein HZH68_003631 [Vespula germanica]|uniref:Uncharacterized protein n=1 Tax=Vespula germanica TaxID=30212 RepID=A0A834NPJ2_VESGE|nr:hypothetical protein HZH68_003631 [Vespula germanica]
MQSTARLRASSQEFEDTREKSGLKFRSKSCHVLAVSPELTPEKGIRNTADLAGTACKASKANTEAAFRPRASPGAKSTCDEFKIDSFAHTDASFKSNPTLFDVSNPGNAGFSGTGGEQRNEAKAKRIRETDRYEKIQRQMEEKRRGEERREEKRMKGRSRREEERRGEERRGEWLMGGKRGRRMRDGE